MLQLDHFIDDANRAVNGEVRVRLHKGHATVVGRRSEDSALYDYGRAPHDAADLFAQSLAEGFVQLWGLPLRTRAATAQRRGEIL